MERRGVNDGNLFNAGRRQAAPVRRGEPGQLSGVAGAYIQPWRRQDVD